MICPKSQHPRTPLVLAVLVLRISCFAGCAGTDEVAREQHVYVDTEFQQQFIEDRDRCQSQGRTIVINGDGARLDRHGVPRSRVNYYCTRIKTE